MERITSLSALLAVALVRRPRLAVACALAVAACQGRGPGPDPLPSNLPPPPPFPGPGPNPGTPPPNEPEKSARPGLSPCRVSRRAQQPRAVRFDQAITTTRPPRGTAMISKGWVNTVGAPQRPGVSSTAATSSV